MSALGQVVPRPRLRSRARGRAGEEAWARPALIGLLAATAFLYLVALSRNGWANAYYTAAVQASTHSWKAFFFGSFDSSSFVTVDKPPASLWVMDLSARRFGVNAWSILAPQALEGVASVALLYATVRRRFGAAAGLLAGTVLALTPAAVLMFRFNNPDALLTLLLVAAAYALSRAVERAQTGWLVLAGTLVGLGFLTKMLQALVVVPGFALVYLVAAPTPVRRRLLQLLGAGAALFVTASSWVAAVALWPASSRPYIGGSQSNSILDLIFGYNGLGRITGNETGSVVGGGGPGGAGQWGATGIGRLFFGAEMGTQVSWLLPAALLFLGAALWLGRRAPRTDGRRADVLVWGTWLVVTGLVFSEMQGIIHPYYTVVLGPAIGALVGIGATWTWARRDLLFARLALAAAIGITSVWGFALLARTPSWDPWLRYAIVFAGLAVATGIALLPAERDYAGVARFAAIVAVAVAVALVAPAAYAAQTVSTSHSGALPTADPAGASTMRGPGGAGRGFPGGAAGIGNGPPGGFAAGGPGGGGGLGGLLDASTPSSALVKLLRRNAGEYTWAAASVGANSAAGVEIASGEPVMAIGGFNGTDPTPTLAQFERDIAAGKIHYFLASGGGGFGGGPGGGSASSSAIATWVAAHFGSSTVGGVTVYDLTARTSS